MTSRQTRTKRYFVLVLLVFSAACAPRPKPVAAEVTLQDAMTRLQANDAAGAVRILDEVTKKEPSNGRAWRNLALANQRLKNLDAAMQAYKQALDVDPSFPTPMFQLAILSASKDDHEEAFAWLSKAKASHKLDMTQMDATPELAALKTDPRYAAL